MKTLTIPEVFKLSFGKTISTKKEKGKVSYTNVRPFIIKGK